MRPPEAKLSASPKSPPPPPAAERLLDRARGSRPRARARRRRPSSSRSAHDLGRVGRLLGLGLQLLRAPRRRLLGLSFSFSFSASSSLSSSTSCERALVLLVVEEQDAAEQEDSRVQQRRRRRCRASQAELHFLSVLMPTLAMPILRTSSSTATTFLKSAPASLLMMTLRVLGRGLERLQPQRQLRERDLLLVVEDLALLVDAERDGLVHLLLVAERRGAARRSAAPPARPGSWSSTARP